jgi:protein TonB
MGVAYPIPETEIDLPVRSVRRKPRRQRIAGLAAALALEALVVLALLTLGSDRFAEMAKEGVPLKTFDLAAPSPEPVVEAVKTPETKTVATEAEPQPRAVDAPAVPARTTPSVQPPTPAPPQPAPLVQLSPGELAAADLRSLPSAAKPARTYGPAAPSSASDTLLVDGTGPNGEKLYAAAWQREPSEGELRGYLSTAQPGWGMIACRTVADFKVDDCVAVGESRGSQWTRAMLAAAWQFRVRPPRIGGRLQIGEWVRIRFDYSQTRRNAWEKDRD